VIGTYASAIAITAASIVLGRGILVLAGRDGSTWLSPAVGFAALMVVCQVALSLPGRGWTAVAAIVILCAASIWVGVSRGAGWPSGIDTVVVGAGMLVLLSVPFLANGRVGILGVAFLNDTHWHLLLAEGMRRPAISAYGYGVGYPLGPHAIAATFAQGLGTDVDKTLTGVLMAAPLLTAFTALGALSDLSKSRRWLVALLTGIPYLAAAWYAESAFKEPILALLLLGLVLALEGWRRDRFARPGPVAVTVAFLIAGVLYDYSYPGLLWVAAAVAGWVVVELVFGGLALHLRSVLRGSRAVLPAAGIGLLVLIVLLAPDVKRIHDFWVANGGTSAGNYGGVSGNSLANLVSGLHSSEGVNIWLTGDFRFTPANPLHAGVLAGFALIVLIYGVVTALERRELVTVGAIVGLIAAYFYVNHTQSAYVTSKALMIPGPLFALVAGRALMLRVQRSDWLSVGGLAAAAAAVVFFVFAFQSSYLALRDAFVGPNDHTNELRALRPVLHGKQTLALYYDDYVSWELLGTPVSSPLLGSPIPIGFRPEKPFTYGAPIDFDSVRDVDLDRYSYVITTRSDGLSQPPPNFHLVASSRSYEVWQRVGPTPAHEILAEGGSPGARLDCHTPTGLQISRLPGYAMVRPALIAVAPAPLLPGGSEQLALHLPNGRWDLSLQFLSDQALTIRGGGLNVWLPPNKDRPGSMWPVGRVVSTGAPIVLTIHMHDPGLIQSDTQYFAPQGLMAVRPGPDRRIPLRKACGQYVDWYVPQ
jgi:hypothetical protein